LTLKILCGVSSSKGLNQVLPKFEPFGLNSLTFFQIKKPLDQFLTQVWFHVHIAHSFMLKIIWAQSFIKKLNSGLCKYKVEQLIKINIYL